MTDLKLKQLWQAFGDTPINDYDEIDEQFLHFEVGTDKMYIWDWFDQKHSIGLYILMGHKKK